MHKNSGQVRPELDTVLGLEQSKLSGEQQAALRALIGEFSDVFAMDNFELGCTEEVMHSIDTGDQPPVRQLPRRIPFALRGKVTEMVSEMLEHDLIQPSKSPWASPIVLV